MDFPHREHIGEKECAPTPDQEKINQRAYAAIMGLYASGIEGSALVAAYRFAADRLEAGILAAAAR